MDKIIQYGTIDLPLNQAIEAGLRTFSPAGEYMIKIEVYVNDVLKGVIDGYVKDGQISCTIPAEMNTECGRVTLKRVD